MTPFIRHEGIAVPLDIANIDTDQIIPARFLPRDRRAQAEGAFRDLRFGPDGRPDMACPLNQPGYAGASILVAGPNFGCGSSRENAVTVLADAGIRAFIAPSFGEIFHNNCYQNGLLPVILPAARVDALLRLLQAQPGARIGIDLQAESVTGPDGRVDRFATDPFRRDCLLAGVDDIGLTFTHLAAIESYEAAGGKGRA